MDDQFAKMAQECGLDAEDFSDPYADDFAGQTLMNYPAVASAYDMYDYNDGTDDISTYMRFCARKN
jgi:hypothetical protein